MGEGAPDYVHLRQILARDALGNLVPVACDPSGRIILLPYGIQTVAQDDPTRTIQGANGLDLHTIAVDDQGRLIMLPYGWDGSAYRKLKVDEEGRMVSVMKGKADFTWGLRGWWKFIASEETTIKDYSGYANNGIAYSGVAEEANYVDGIVGQGLEVDGDNDYVSIPDDDSLDLIDVMTLEAWIFRIAPSGDVNEYIIIKDKNYHMAVTSTGKLFGSLRIPPTSNYRYTSEEPISLGTWHHLVLVVPSDPTAATFYLDGNLFPTTYNISVVAPDYTKLLNLGAYSSAAHHFEGYIDEVRIYARPLSSEEVAWRYNNTNPATGKPTRMVAVDSEGRMMVNIEGLPYKDQLLIRKDKASPAAASIVKVYSDLVPPGRIWVIESCLIDHDTDAITFLQIGIDRSGIPSMFAEDLAAGIDGTLSISTPLYLKAGDRLYSSFALCSAGIHCHLYGNGYELSIL